MKRMSFIGDGLSHVAFGAVAISSALGTWLKAADIDVSASGNMIIVLPITLVSAVLLLRVGQNSKIKGDAVVAMISVGALALGYILMNVFSPSSNVAGDVCSTLFGSTSIITLTANDVLLCIILSLLVVCTFVVFYHRIFAVTFDENFASATGIKAGAYNLLIAIILGVVIVLAMNLIGSLLVSALVVFPALSAMRVFRSFKSVIIASVLISVACAILGILASILLATPVGSTVVVFNIISFLLFTLIGSVKTKVKGA